MKIWSEMIEEHWDELLEAIKEADESAYRYNNIREVVYLWDDGRITILEDVAGGNMRYAGTSDGRCVAIAQCCHEGFNPVWDCYSVDELLDSLDLTYDDIVAAMTDKEKEVWFVDTAKDIRDSADRGFIVKEMLETHFLDELEELFESEIEHIQSETDYDEILDNVIDEYKYFESIRSKENENH